ncbi:restriction endonuclease subunit S [Photobacterium leiognathi]|uniref:restriction endonuclease subunit S n=1 Tax=Photobacterium leiognathi TaxID=553611 RepID=UPI0029811E31|nr:restriction endonuclease subunit S [Photobacterium leiognathi]
MSILEQEIPDGYQKTEIGVIPKSWQSLYLGDLAEIRMCKRVLSWQTSKSGPIPFFKIGTFGGQPDAFISNSLYNDFKKKFSFPHKGDVLISAAGTIGKTVVYDGEDAYFQDSNIVWLEADKTKILNEYLYHYYKVINWASTEGSTISRLYNGIIKASPIATPPLKEQIAIANALSDVDALLTELEKLIAKKQAIKTATMQQLLTGKTRLPQFATYTEGEKQGQLKGTKTSELGEIPEDWGVFEIGTLFNITAGGDLRKNQFSPIRTDKHSYPIYSNAITNKGLYGYCSTFDYNGEYLTITARGGIGHAVERDGRFCAIGRLLVLSSKEKNNCKYVAEFANQYINFANESTGVPQLTAPQVAKYNIAMPKHEEQTAIATILSDMDSEIQTLEHRLAKTRQIKQGMMQELLTGRTRLPFKKDS